MAIREPDGETPRLVTRLAQPADLLSIIQIERECFRSPWSARALFEAITCPDAVYIVAQRNAGVLGYAGMHICLDEGHVSTVGVSAAARKQGIGEAMMLALLNEGAEAGIARVFLEYRVSNHAAAGLYEKLGFRQNRVRRRYYTDNGEDAIEALLDDLSTPERLSHFQRLQAEWETRHGACQLGCR